MQDLLKRTLEGLPSPERRALMEIAAFGERCLGPLPRRSGESYAEHCREVAAVLREITDDPMLVGAALLHDLPLHPDGAALLSQAPLTSEQRAIVDSMHRLRRLHIDEHTKDLDTVLHAFMSDQRLLPLRMAHRLNDVRGLRRFTKTLARSIARETLHMYSAIAGRLSMHAWRHEMEDTCFLFLQPATAQALQKQFAHFAPGDRQCLDHVSSLLKKELAARGIGADLSHRTKTLYSSYRKMAVKRRRLEELTDRLAVRVIVPSVDDCYRALGAVHGCLHPIPGKLKDYIGAPKENGYRSIHTVVYPLPGVTEYPVEVQIRTPEMHEACEYGSARHADYKHCLYGLQSRFARVDLFNNLLILRESAHTPEQFGRLLRTYFNEKQIVLFGADGSMHHLRSPVTALDFACQTSGKRVRSMKSVRVNGRPAPPDTVLKDGDTVECAFGRMSAVTAEWQHACRQPSSRALLRDLLQEHHALNRPRNAKRS
jgi:GTP diphosphokinase / guanosine-3',5'-bis(diphosphate) 3'-diphosphatase